MNCYLSLHENHLNLCLKYILTCVFRPKLGKQGGDMLAMIRKLLSGQGLDDALHLFGLAGMDENKLPT